MEREFWERDWFEFESRTRTQFCTRTQNRRSLVCNLIHLDDVIVMWQRAETRECIFWLELENEKQKRLEFRCKLLL